MSNPVTIFRNINISPYFAYFTYDLNGLKCQTSVTRTNPLIIVLFRLKYYHFNFYILNHAPEIQICNFHKCYSLKSYMSLIKPAC